MKIRTGFVTNSSGSSSSRVKIENEVLYELLKKYQDRLNAEIKKHQGREIKCVVFEDDKYICDEDDFIHDDENVVFWNFRGENVSDIPSKYIKKLQLKLVDFLEIDVVSEIFNELSNELKEKGKLINKSYKLIEGSYFASSYSDGTSSNSSQYFTYDSNNICPKCGAVLIEKNDHVFVDDYEETGEFPYSYDYNLIYCSNKKCDYRVKEHNEEEKLPSCYESSFVKENDDSFLRELAGDDILVEIDDFIF